MANSSSPNDLEDTGPNEAPEEEGWTTLGIALPRELKARFEALALKKHLRPSVYGRILIDEAVTRHEAS